jgi:hypothetical protein
MSTECPTLAEVLAKHWVNNCWWHCDGGTAMTPATHAQHQAEMWREACTISTLEQLDELPIGSVVRTTEERVAVKTGERWGNQSGHGSWWSVADEDEFDLSSDELDDLPALLLFHPDWSK